MITDKNRQYKIYKDKADTYDRLVSKEDYQNHLLPAIQQLTPLDNKIVLELGAGTGRLTELIAPLCRTVLAFDKEAHMLDFAKTKLIAAGIDNVQFQVGRHSAIPAPDHSAHIILAGWTLGYYSFETRWKQKLKTALDEIERLLKPGGTAIIIETLGTGHTHPKTYKKHSDFFDYLKSQGFIQTWIRTDYQFSSVQEAVEIIGDFFGEKLAQEVLNANKNIVPECTGLWSKIF